MVDGPVEVSARQLAREVKFALGREDDDVDEMMKLGFVDAVDDANVARMH